VNHDSRYTGFLLLGAVFATMSLCWKNNNDQKLTEQFTKTA